MATASEQPSLAPRIRGLLRALRWRIRLYTFVDGIAKLVIWAALLFWFALLLDYGPVLLGATEMPRIARAFLLGIAAVGGLVIVYRSIIRRTFASLADHSLALLLERQHREFGDALVTAVELHEQPGHAEQFNRQMLDHTAARAQAHAPEVRLRKVFRFAPLMKSVLLAFVLGGSVLGLALTPATAGTFQQAAKRLTLLDDDPWPRMAYLEVVGVTSWKIEHAPASSADATSLGDRRPQLTPVEIKFGNDKTLRVARQSSPRLIVRADIERYQAPSRINVYWRSVDDAGTANMASGKDTSDGFRYYSYEREPLKDIRESIDFDVRGFDFRAAGYRIEVVDSPVVTSLQLAYDRPNYLVDESRNIFKRVETPLLPGTLVPRGSDVAIHCTANKPLRQVYLYNVETKQTEVLPISREMGAARNQFVCRIPQIERNTTIEAMLVDEDGLVTLRPQLLAVGVKEDKPPEVKVKVRGIGLAVTPDVRLPLVGRVSDEQGVEKTWLEIELDKNNIRKLPVEVQRTGFNAAEIEQLRLEPGDNVHQWIDFRDERSRAENSLQLLPGAKLALTVKSADRYNLENFDVEKNPHAGVGDRYELSVVTPDELLTILERRELELRRRFEQVIDEMTQMRDSLVRVKADPQSATSRGRSEPGDNPETKREPGELKPTSDEAVRRAGEIRRNLVQLAINQTEKSRGETEGVAVSFLDIVAELDNNRVDTEDRKLRLSEQVAQPLLGVVANSFPALSGRLNSLDKALLSPQQTPAEIVAAADEAIAEADKILLAMDQVLQKILDLETFNELIEKVRSLIEEQDNVIEATKKLRKNQFFD